MKMKPTRLLILMLMLAFGGKVFGQQEIWVSHEGIRQVLRVGFGPTMWSVRIPDSTVKRAAGLHLSNEVKIISALSFSKLEKKFAVHDAFYFDINMGGLRGEARGQDLDPFYRERKFSKVINFGYLAAFGYRNSRWAALAGMDFRFRVANAGEFNMPNLYGPLFYYSPAIVLRGEWAFSGKNPNARLVGMAWVGPGFGEKSYPYYSARVELPLGPEARWWLCGQYTTQAAKGEDLYYGGLGEQERMIFSQWMFGFRIHGLP